MGLTPRCDTLKSSLRCCVNAQPELIKLLSMEPTQGADCRGMHNRSYHRFHR